MHESAEVSETFAQILSFLGVLYSRFLPRGVYFRMALNFFQSSRMLRLRYQTPEAWVLPSLLEMLQGCALPVHFSVMEKLTNIHGTTGSRVEREILGADQFQTQSYTISDNYI